MTPTAREAAKKWIKENKNDWVDGDGTRVILQSDITFAYLAGFSAGVEASAQLCDAHYKNELSWSAHYTTKEPNAELFHNADGQATASRELASEIRALITEETP